MNLTPLGDDHGVAVLEYKKDRDALRKYGYTEEKFE